MTSSMIFDIWKDLQGTGLNTSTNAYVMLSYGAIYGNPTCRALHALCGHTRGDLERRSSPPPQVQRERAWEGAEKAGLELSNREILS